MHLFKLILILSSGIIVSILFDSLGLNPYLLAFSVFSGDLSANLIFGLDNPFLSVLNWISQPTTLIVFAIGLLAGLIFGLRWRLTNLKNDGETSVKIAPLEHSDLQSGIDSMIQKILNSEKSCLKEEEVDELFGIDSSLSSENRSLKRSEFLTVINTRYHQLANKELVREESPNAEEINLNYVIDKLESNLDDKKGDHGLDKPTKT